MEKASTFSVILSAFQMSTPLLTGWFGQVFETDPAISNPGIGLGGSVQYARRVQAAVAFVSTSLQLVPVPDPWVDTQIPLQIWARRNGQPQQSSKAELKLVLRIV